MRQMSEIHTLMNHLPMDQVRRILSGDEIDAWTFWAGEDDKARYGASVVQFEMENYPQEEHDVIWDTHTTKR